MSPKSEAWKQQLCMPEPEQREEQLMGNLEKPFVAAIGGLWALDQGRATRAREVGKAIGAELAHAGFGLVVYFSNPESLEPHVVSGYVASLEGGEGEVRVRYAESQRGAVYFAEEATRPELFQHRLFPGQDWEAPFYRSLAEEEGVDAVLLLGGSRATLIAGQIALARRIPILAVDEFGGAAATIWNQLAQVHPERTHAWGTCPAKTLVEQLKRDCEGVSSRRRETRRREQLLESIISRRRCAAYAASAFLALMCTLFLGIVYIPSSAAYPFVMFVGLVAAGATGALARSVLWESQHADPLTSLLLGSIAGFVVGLAYLIPQWVGAPGPLSGKPDSISATDKIQFASSILVALSAGVGFDTVFSRLQKQAEDAKIGPPV
jgi:hypothetical protein